MDMVRAKIDGLALDITTNSPVVILSPENSDKILPIWIGHYEAWAIGMELSGITSKRPLTHDLLASIITAIGGKVERIEITELKEQTFYAAVYIKKNDVRHLLFNGLDGLFSSKNRFDNVAF